MARSRRARIGIAAGVAVAVAVVAVIVVVSQETGGVRRTRAGDGAGAAGGAVAGLAAPVHLQVVPDPASEEIPGAHCWQGLLEVDRSGSIAELRRVLARATGSGDELLATYVADRLVELVGADAARAHELLDGLTGAGGQETEVILGALARTAAVRDPGVAERLLRTAEERDGDEVARAFTIGALETQARLEPATLARVTAVALDDAAPGVAWTATRTLGRVMKEDFERTGSYEPYLDQLLRISASTRDPAVRVLALEMPAYVDPVLGSKYIDELAAVLRDAPERELREMAAFQLGLTEDPARVLGVFRAAFPRERDVCVRWAMLRFAVRAGGASALPVLDEMARLDARFASDVAEFRRIYATGIQDFERVWLDKAEHPACSADHDDHEPGGA